MRRATVATVGTLALLAGGLAAVSTPAGAAPRSTAPTRSTSADKGPVGWDTFRRLDRLPTLPTDGTTRQFSSFDRSGGNDHDGFDGKYSCLRTESDGCVIAEADGAGEVDSIWFTRDEGDVTRTGDIRVVLDGRTVLHAPLQDVVDGKVGAPFVHPLVSNADQSSGGVVIKVPMPYRRSMKVVTEENPLFYHVTYRRFGDADGVRTFDPGDHATDVLRTLRAAGTRDPKPAAPGRRTQSRRLQLAEGAGTTLASARGGGQVTALRLRLPHVVGATQQQITDDGRAFGQGGSSRFTVAVDPANDGVVLTRRHETHIGNQRADVYVDGTLAGTWAPTPATGASQWADQTVTLPASLTKGKSSLTVENRFVSSDLDFNEFHYWVDSKVDGATKRTDEVDVGPDHTAQEQAHDYAITAQTWQGTPTLTYPPTAAQSRRVAASDDVLSHTRLRVSFDGHRTVDAPVGEFFGSGLGESPVRSLFFAMDPDGWYSAWWPMPYARSVRVRLVNRSGHALRDVRSQVTIAPSHRWSGRLAPRGDAGYFTALSHRGATRAGHDWVFADRVGRGRFVGVSSTMQGRIPSGNTRAYLEGDERVLADGSLSPDLHGTGTEDFYESGWYFNRGTYSGAFTGDTGHELGGFGCRYECDSTYRLMLSDAVAYRTALRFSIEHGPVSDAPAVYGSTAFLYAKPRFTQRQTDVVDVGVRASERAHRATGGGGLATLTSTYEGDFDSTQVRDELRSGSAPSAFTVRVARRNHGVVLRRTSDQRQGYQTADVSVDGRRVGTWKQPLANDTHRWLDDSFVLPRRVTDGHSRLRVRLVPRGPTPWTAARYEARSVVPAYADRTAPHRVRGLRARAGEDNVVHLTWKPPADDSGVRSYRVYAARGAAVPVGPSTLLGTTRVPGFTHTDGLRSRWSYRVVAVDGAGHASRPSASASATTGDVQVVEGESMLPAISSTAPVVSQGSCCGVTWSGGAQLWFRATRTGDEATLPFTVSQAGRYDLSAVLTQAPDYGTVQLLVDGQPVGQPFDGYHAGGVTTAEQPLGSLALGAAAHRLTLRVTGRDPDATGSFAGLDVLRLRLTRAR